jgi:hypothetical protein
MGIEESSYTSGMSAAVAMAAKGQIDVHHFIIDGFLDHLAVI